MIAFHFPPMKGSSGLQRTLSFVRELGDLGWQARILTTWRSGYPQVSDEQLGDIPRGLIVRRPPCLDVARHLAVRGSYPGILARPDRWSSWLPGLVACGIAECRSWKPDLIWSTFPIPTAVVGGRILSRWTGIPGILDLRDSMTEDEYPPNPSLRRQLRAIESKAVHQARAVVFTSPGAARMYAGRYPELPAEHWHVIPNGYDEGHFAVAESAAAGRHAERGGRTLLLHSGLLDPVDRDPTAFFRALADLKAARESRLERLIVRLRASGNDRHYQPVIRELGLADIVELAPPLPYDDALREMIDADGLLVFQGSNCNHQTPAKLYEYFRAGTPILGMTDPQGDTAHAMRAAGLAAGSIVPIQDPAAIARSLSSFVADVRSGRADGVRAETARQWSRARHAGLLAGLMAQIAGDPRSGNESGEQSAERGRGRNA